MEVRITQDWDAIWVDIPIEAFQKLTPEKKHRIFTNLCARHRDVSPNVINYVYYEDAALGQIGAKAVFRGGLDRKAPYPSSSPYKI